MHFGLNYTFWLNLVFGALALYLFWLARRHPMSHDHHHHGGDGTHGHDAGAAHDDETDATGRPALS